jgi:hypothetical protein
VRQRLNWTPGIDFGKLQEAPVLRRPTVLDVSRCLATFLVADLLVLVGPSAAGQQDRSGASGRKAAFVSEAPLAAESSSSPKLDPLLRRLVRDHGNRASLAWAVGSETVEPTIRTETMPGGRLAAGVFVKTANGAVTTADIRALGGYVRVEAGEVLVAVVPVSSLETLATATEVFDRGKPVFENAARREQAGDQSRPRSVRNRAFGSANRSGRHRGSGRLRH